MTIPTLAVATDVAGLLAAVLAAWLWYRASGRTVRRLSRHEVLDAADINRLVTAINRTQILNGRAALAAALAALMGALRFGLDLVGR